VKDDGRKAMDLFDGARGGKEATGGSPEPSEDTHRGDEAGARPERPADPSPHERGPERSSGGGHAASEEAGLFRGETTIGEMLLAARERLGQTLEFMSQETKIPKPMLQYLETDNYEAIPAKVYAKSFLRTYAAALGLDVQHILSKYEVQTGQTHRSKGDHWEIESEIVEEKIRSPIVLRRFVIPAIIGISLIAIIVRFAGKREESPKPQARQSLKEELLDTKLEQPATELRQSIPVEPQSGVEPMELRISSNPTDSCWFELMTISVVEQQPETTLSKFSLPPGRSRAFQATEEFMFKKVGNAGGFVMELNGNKLPTLGRKGKVVLNYRITRENLPKERKKE
jgi:cytoskeleton protein RodZ